MKNLLRFPLLFVFTVVATAVVAASASAKAEPILSVDFGGTAVQGGFTGAFTAFSDSQGPLTVSFQVPESVVASGNIQAGIAGSLDFSAAKMNVRTRLSPANDGEFTYSNLFRDRVVDITSGGEGLFLQLSGLDPNTPYSIQVWGYDSGKAGDFKLFDRTDGNNLLLGGYTVTAGAVPLSNDGFSVLGLVTADASGSIVVQAKSNIDGAGIMNGFVLSAVPEPGTAAALLGGMGVLMLGGRLRRSR